MDIIELANRGIAVVRSMPGGSFLIRIAADIVRGDITDRAMTLAAQAFTSVLPVVILLMTLPGSAILSNALSDLGIDPQRVDVVSSTTPESFAAFGVVGALFTIAGATSLSRALGRVYVSIWGVRKLSWQSWWRWVLILFLIPAAVALQGLATQVRGWTLGGPHIGDDGVLGVFVEIVLTLLLWTVVWTVVPRLLVSGQVPWRLLAVAGTITGVLVTALLVGSRIALPRIMRDTTNHYGTLGMILVAISWLFFFAGIVIAGTLVAHSAAVDDGLVGGWLRRHAGAPQPFPDTSRQRRVDLDAPI